MGNALLFGKPLDKMLGQRDIIAPRARHADSAARHELYLLRVEGTMIDPYRMSRARQVLVRAFRPSRPPAVQDRLAVPVPLLRSKTLGRDSA
jgi:hypothetical protein